MSTTLAPPLSQLQITVVGLGLMGGSLVLALGKFASNLTGVDTNAQAVDHLLQKDLIAHGTTDFATGIKTADLIIFATPPHTTISLLHTLPTLKKEATHILDLSSTKQDICSTMATLPPHFSAIGGHPLCGREQSGWQAITTHLYQDKKFLYTPIPNRTTPQLLNILHQLITEIGARPVEIDATQHDLILSMSSHLPHLLANLLIATATQFTDEEALDLPTLWQLTGTGFASSSRLAGGDPEMMSDIVSTNKTAVLQQLNRLHQQLNQLQDIIENQPTESVHAWLNKHNNQYQMYQTNKNQK